MKTILLVFGCAAILLAQPARAIPQTPPEPVKHGGKIETKYDGFNYETVMRLRKMKVNCDGLKDTFKDACVSIEVALHCPGTQVNYVRHVTLQVVFENKDWVHLHPPDQRDLTIVTDTETLRLGRMSSGERQSTGHVGNEGRNIGSEDSVRDLQEDRTVAIGWDSGGKQCCRTA